MAPAEPGGGGPHRRPGDPVGQLPPQPWRTAAPTRTVLAVLTAGGAEVRFVGGCVRDAVCRRPVRDIDLATSEPPDLVLRRLAAGGLRGIPTGLAHGTVTALVGGVRFEITTLRRDVETDGRHAKVAFTDDWVADAARRDFTINALSADPDGRIYDPFDGLADLGAGRVRFVGLPARRIEEDALRLLRFFRFHAWFGRGDACDRDALAACRRFAPRLATLSGERIAAEMLRLLQAEDPATTLVVMQANGVLAPILPELRDIARLRQLAWLERRGLARPDIRPDPLRRLAALLGPDPAEAAAVAARLRLSAADRDRLAALAAAEPAILPMLSAAAFRRLLYRHGASRLRDRTLLAWAAWRDGRLRPDPADTAAWIGLLDLASRWEPVALPVRGADLLALGLAPGPAVGRLLADLEEWWAERDFRPDRAACLAEARARL
ncbi:MAG: hypothetical protein RLZZ501_492 [Pseudomonadota bacterium]|jgi:poly(A) polymerase